MSPVCSPRHPVVAYLLLVRPMRLFLIASITIATAAMASDQPKIDGRVNAVSASDVRHISAAARDWLHSTPDFARRFGQRISLIHIVSADKAEVHVGSADIPSKRLFCRRLYYCRADTRCLEGRRRYSHGSRYVAIDGIARRGLTNR
jgi:hypothetical protein